MATSEVKYFLLKPFLKFVWYLAEMLVTFCFSDITYDFYGCYTYITYICCIHNAQNFGFCDSFDKPRWYGTHQKMQKSYFFRGGKLNTMRLFSFKNDHGLCFRLASPFQNQSKNVPQISGSTLTNIGLTGPSFVLVRGQWEWGEGG
jgi:hypothetical protein